MLNSTEQTKINKNREMFICNKKDTDYTALLDSVKCQSKRKETKKNFGLKVESLSYWGTRER